MLFINLRKFPSVPHLLRVPSWWLLTFSNVFTTSIDMIIFFSSLIWWFTLIDFFECSTNLAVCKDPPQYKLTLYIFSQILHKVQSQTLSCGTSLSWLTDTHPLTHNPLFPSPIWTPVYFQGPVQFHLFHEPFSSYLSSLSMGQSFEDEHSSKFLLSRSNIKKREKLLEASKWR